MAITAVLTPAPLCLCVRSNHVSIAPWLGGVTYNTGTYYRLYNLASNNPSNAQTWSIGNRGGNGGHPIFSYVPDTANFYTSFLYGLTTVPGAIVLGEWQSGVPAVTVREMQGQGVGYNTRVVDVNSRPGESACCFGKLLWARKAGRTVNNRHFGEWLIGRPGKCPLWSPACMVSACHMGLHWTF